MEKNLLSLLFSKEIDAEEFLIFGDINIFLNKVQIRID